MDIEKTLEYLENVMSSEVRIITLEQEIKNLREKIDYSNEYYDYLRAGKIEKIFIPSWLLETHVFALDFNVERWNRFGSGYDGRAVWRYFNSDDTYHLQYDEDIEEANLGCVKTFDDFVNNSKYFEKAKEISTKVIKSIKNKDNTTSNSFKYLNVPVVSFYRCLLHEFESFLGIDTRDEVRFISETLPVNKEIDGPCYHRKNEYVGAESTSRKGGFSGDKIIEAHTYYHINDIFYLIDEFYSFFKAVPFKIHTPSADRFRELFIYYFRSNKMIIREEYKKRDVVLKTEERDLYSDQEVEQMAETLYPYYCELLSASNEYLISCYDHIVEGCTNDTIIKNIGPKKLQEMTKMLQDEKETLEKLYGLGVIFQKYRSIVPLGSFIDYFASGRCNSFEGADGAYNLYENELRLDRISDKLDVIITQLEDIKSNQRAIFYALTEMRETLQSIHTSIDNATHSITDTIKAEGAATRVSLNSISSTLSTISSNTSAISAAQDYSNKLQQLTNDRLNSIILNQEFEQRLYSDPTIFGGRSISDKAYGKYH